MPADELHVVDEEAASLGARLLREGDVEGGLALLARAARVGNAPALADYSWWCLRNGHEDWALDLGNLALAACVSVSGGADSGPTPWSVANAASNLALCRLAVGGEPEVALSTWREGEGAEHAESWFYPAILALREGRDSDAQRLVERLPPPARTRMRELVLAEVGCASPWFAGWCTDGASLLNRCPSTPMAVRLVDFDGLLLNPEYVDDWVGAYEEAESAGRASLRTLRDFVAGEGEIALIGRCELGIRLALQSDPGSSGFSEGWEHLWAATQSRDPRTVSRALWAIAGVPSLGQVDRQSVTEFFLGSVALGETKAVFGLMDTLTESGHSEVLHAVLSAPESLVGQDSPAYSESQERIKMICAMHPNVSADDSGALAMDDSARVRASVLWNPHAPAKVRRALLSSCSEDADLLDALLNGSLTTESMLLQIAPLLFPWESETQDSELNELRGVPIEHLGRVLVKLAQHPNATDQLLRRLASPGFHSFLASNPEFQIPGDIEEVKSGGCLCRLISENPSASLHLWGEVTFAEMGLGTISAQEYSDLRRVLQSTDSKSIGELATELSQVLITHSGEDTEAWEDGDSDYMLRVMTAMRDPSLTARSWSDIPSAYPDPTYSPYDLSIVGQSLASEGARERLAFALAVAQFAAWLPEWGGNSCRASEWYAAAFLAWSGFVADDSELLRELGILVLEESELIGTRYLRVGLSANPNLDMQTALLLAEANSLFGATNPLLSREETVERLAKLDLGNYDVKDELEALLLSSMSAPLDGYQAACRVVAGGIQGTRARMVWALLLEGLAIGRGLQRPYALDDRGLLALVAEQLSEGEWVDRIPYARGIESLVALLDTHDELAELARASGWDQADIALTRSSRVTEEDLRRIASHGNSESRAAVAGNESTPSDVLSSLAMDSDTYVRTEAFKNPRTTDSDRAAASLLGVALEWRDRSGPD